MQRSSNEKPVNQKMCLLYKNSRQSYLGLELFVVPLLVIRIVRTVYHKGVSD